MDINFSKYKRFFAFGCSFTNYHWPTWADIISKEMPDAEFNNFGHCGGGNLLIAAKITEANTRFKFNENDLVIVMWTTFCREDRFRHGNWMGVGNMFSQGVYDEEFVRKFADTTGYLIRDLAVITMAKAYLEALPCDSILLPSVPFDHQMDMADVIVKNALQVYDGMIKSHLPNLYELEMNGQWENGHEYPMPGGPPRGDYHPNPIRYWQYLDKLGVPLTERSKQYAIESTRLLHTTKTEKETTELFPKISTRSLF